MRVDGKARGHALAVLTAVVVALLVTFASVRAEDDEDLARERWLVLGADGEPVTRAYRARATERHPAGWVFDAERGGGAAAIRDGVLEVPSPARDAGADVVWSPGLAAATLPRGGVAVGVRLVAAAPLAGSLRFERGEPAGELPVLAVAVGRRDLVHRVRTDEGGRFRFEHVAPGPWEVFVVRGDGRDLSLGVFLAGDVVRPPPIRAGSRLEGRVLDADASGRTGAGELTFRLLPLPRDASGAGQGAFVTSDAEGNFVARDVPGGVYEAELETRGLFFSPRRPRVEVPTRGTVRLRGWYVARTRSVTGRVEGPRGVAVPGAKVVLVPDPTATEPQGGWPRVEPVETTAEGAFLLEGLREADGYRVAVRAEGYSFGLTEPFEVAGRAPTSVGVVRLVRGWRLEVRCRAPGGTPVEGARVEALSASHPSIGEAAGASPFLVWRGATDAGGRVVLGDLPNEDVRVRADAEGLVGVEGVVPIPRTGDMRVWNATLHEAPRLRGEVVPTGAFVVAGLEVRVRPQDDGATQSTRLDGQGRFAFEGLDAVPMDVEVAFDGGPALARVAGVVPGSVDHLRIQLPTLLSIRGRVDDVRPGGGAVEALLEASVHEPRHGEHRWRVVASVALTPSGRRASFGFGPLAPGVYAVRARQGANDSGAETVRLEAQSVENLELALPQGGRVAGTVLDDRSMPVLGADLRLERLRGEGESPHLPGGPLRRASDRGGAYVFADVAPGVWRVSVQEDGLAVDQEVLRVAEGESLLVRDLVLRAGGVLEGVVTDADGRALDGARLDVEAVEEGVQERIEFTGRDGRFRASGLRPGVWRVRLAARAGAFTDLETLVEVVEGETTELALEARGQARVEGRVLRRGRAVAGAVVYLVRRDPPAGELGRRLETRSDATGRFGWDSLDAGEYEVDLVDGGVHSRRPLTLRATDIVTLDLEAHAGRIPGEVVLLSGVPVQGATVRARPSGETRPELEARVLTDPEGRFVLTGLPPRAYDLDVFGAGLPPGRAFGVVAEEMGADRAVTITLGRGGTVELRILGPQSRGIGATRVWLEDEAGNPLDPRPYVTVPHGRLVVEGVPEGRWWLRVHALRYGRPPRLPVTVKEGETTKRLVRLAPAGYLLARVSAAGRDPVTRARVDLLRLPEREPVEQRRRLGRVRLLPPWGHLPRTGEILFEDLASGSYLLRVDAGSYFEVAEVPVVVNAGDTAELEVVLQRRPR